jgi:phage shock protein E
MNGMKIKKHFAFAAVFIFGALGAGWSLDNHFSAPAELNTPAKVPIFLDVRTDSEWEAGHLDNAVHFDLQELQNGKLPEIAKDLEIKVYCRSGKRAETAKGILENNGFLKVENVGGYEGLVSGKQKTCAGKLARCE